MVFKVNSMGIFGMKSYMVEVEVYVSRGKFRFDTVGLPDAAVTESKERVLSAVKNSGYAFPLTHIVVNLAPADIKKEGSLYDLPIFTALLGAAKGIDFDSDESAFIGELSLSGDVRPVKGVLPMVIEAEKAGIKRVFVPYANGEEAAIVEGIEVFPVKNVRQLIEFFIKDGKKEEEPLKCIKRDSIIIKSDEEENILDFSDVKGQRAAKRALEVAAAGGHNLLMSGPPGSGKSMLAKRLPTILPDMTREEALETTKIYSIAGEIKGNAGLITKRPFRSPHHTISSAGLSGGGTVPRPGELSMAHNGVLFLDELPEFSRSVLEVMRQPIEDGVITISRASGALTFPCSVMLICAMNPCPCGYYGHPVKPCTCTVGAITRYLNRISGPLLDRIDIKIDVPAAEFTELSSDTYEEETSAQIKKRVDAARQIQTERFNGTSINCNAKMTSVQTRKFCILDDMAKELLQRYFEKLGLSGRAYDKILKVARTIADLDGSEIINKHHIAEAIRYRNDRN